jgi:peptidoglycan/xylan/chitin deacetylase (PgdA/CDA1 family)
MSARLLSALYKLIGNRLSRGSAAARLSILIYHRVLPERDPLFPDEPTTDTFDVQMRALKAVFNVLPLSEAIARLKACTLPARAAAITFDDGYADNATHALPILRRYDLSATFFIATGYLNGGRMFNDTVIESIRRTSKPQLDLSTLGLGVHDLRSDQAKATAINAILPKVKYLPVAERDHRATAIAAVSESELPADLMMSTAQLRTLHTSGMEIGAHTDRHPILATCSDADARREITTSKAWLEEVLGSRITLFAYPNGKPNIDYRPAQAEIVRGLGFDAAVSTAPGVSVATSDLYQLPRFTPWGGSATFVPRLLNNLRSV